MPVYRVKFITEQRVWYCASTTIEASTRNEVEDVIDANGDNLNLLEESVVWNECEFEMGDEEVESVEECQEKPEFRLGADGLLVRVEKETQ